MRRILAALWCSLILVVALVACGSDDGAATPGDPASGTVDGSAGATCTDKAKNGSESDVDCGGGCAKCGEGKTCNAASDCTSGVCTGGRCAAGPVTPPPAPVITSFAAAKPKITSGKSTTLIAVFTGGTGTVDNAVGAVTSGVEVPTGNLTATTTFKLTVTNTAGESVTATTAVEVVAAPTITSFTAAEPKVSRGSPGSLTAVFTGGTGAVDMAIGAVTSGAPVATANLLSKTKFTLTVTNELADSVTASVEIDVKKELFVTNYGAADSLAVFEEDATGAATPKRTIAGANTTFSNPRGLSVVNDEIFVANDSGNGILVFNVGDSGNIAPKRAIVGAATTLSDPTSLFVTNNEIFVGNRGPDTIAVFNVADNGDVAPKRSIGGANTLLNNPNGIAVDGGSIYVALEGGAGGVSVFPQAGTGDIAPTRTISGAQSTGLLIAGDEVFLTTPATPTTLTVYNKTTGAMLRQIAGANTGFAYYGEQCAIVGVEILCASYGNNTLRGFPVGGDGNIAPTRTITGLSGPLGVYLY